jgi:uncharacterized circularly permuted ATP-grasp superfamily protein
MGGVTGVTGVNRPDFDLMRGYFDKWEVHCALVGEPIGPCKIPKAAVYSPEEMARMMHEFSSVMVKPLHTWGGYNISKVWSLHGQTHWRLQGQSSVRTYSALEACIADLTAVYPERSAIIQQTAPVVDMDGRPFDIRVHMQRDNDESWVLAGALARIGGRDSIVSNVQISQGTVQPVADVLAKAVPTLFLSNESIEACFREIGLNICRVMDQYHAFDEIGIDIGVDAQGDFWLFEVNTNDADGCPSHELFAQLPDKRVYNEIQDRYNQRNIDTASSIFQQLFGMEETESSD